MEPPGRGALVYAEVFMWLTIWLTTSPMIMLGIKRLTTDPRYAFPYPWLMTAGSNSVIFVLGNFAVYLTDADSGEMEVPWSKALVLGVMQGFEIGLGNTVIQNISLSLRTELHMLTPALMYAIGLALGIERLRPMLAVSVLFVTMGGVLGTWGAIDHKGQTMLAPAALAALSAVMRWNLTQKWLSPRGMRIRPSPLVLVSRMAPATACTSLLVSFFYETWTLGSLSSLPQAPQLLALLLGIGAGICILLSAELHTVQLTSALLLAFLTPFHNVSIIIMDTLLKGTHISPVNWVGIILCSAATFCYGAARHNGTPPPAKESLAAVA